MSSIRIVEMNRLALPDGREVEFVRLRELFVALRAMGLEPPAAGAKPDLVAYYRGLVDAELKKLLGSRETAALPDKRLTQMAIDAVEVAAAQAKQSRRKAGAVAA